ncbi:protein takeout-like [Periplaneta americana]|uniref:protein takeout-like n=1 Tax=Periplaneta americana TaxID=6978 RepID=UPI0037E737AA
MWQVLILFAAAVHVAQSSLPLPPYIKACIRGEPNFNECAVKHGREAFPHLIPGDRKYNFPPLDPIQIDEIKVIEGGPRAASLNLVLRNAKIYGVRNTTIENFTYDFENQHIQHRLFIPKVEILAQYEASGRILLLPLFGKGDMNITLDNAHITYDEDYTLDVIDGRRHIRPKNPQAVAVPSRVYFQMDNLFNGDKFLSNQMNEFLNENWKDIYKELSPTVFQVFTKIVVAMISRFDEIVSFDDMFPEKLPQ